MDDLIQSINTDVKFGAEQLGKQPHSSFINDEFMTKTIDLNTKNKTMRMIIKKTLIMVMTIKMTTIKTPTNPNLYLKR